MPMKRCSAGKHFYNPEAHEECPECALSMNGSPSDDKAPAMPSAPIPTDMIEMPEQEGPAPARGGYVPTKPLARPGRPEVPVPPPGAAEATPASPATDNPFMPRSAGSPRTQIILPGKKTEDTESMGHLPVTGWLVIVEGPGLGRDFRLIQGENRIGRERSMEVCLDFGAQSDETVSRDAHAIVVYDNNANEFFIERGRSRNMPMINDRTIRRDQTLAAWDIIQVGRTRLLFFPLCDEQFRW